MMTRNMFLVLLVFGIFSTHVLETEGFESAIITALTSQALSLWKSGSRDFMGNECQYRITPKIRRWKLKYEGKFWCPAWVPFSGRGTSSSRSGSVSKAVRNFVEQAVARDLIDQKEAEIWLQS